MKKPILLCILDGVGYREETHGNAVKKAKMPNFNNLLENYPHSLLEASGPLVGLPEGQMGNSEVGHMNIGAGRIMYQPLELINSKIKDNSFYENEELLKVINHTKENNSKLHICGLLSDGGIHSHINHLFALIELCKKENIKNVYFHLFLDGRDTLPNVAYTYIDKLNKKIENTTFKIATISGRYYSMDRDNRWDRVEKAYNAMTNGENKINDINSYIEESYKNEVLDEFIVPATIDENGIIEDNDGIIVFNFRPDRVRELFSALSNKHFDCFERKIVNNLKVVTMMKVSEDVVSVPAFALPKSSSLFGEVISNNNLNQLRIAETEKYAHVTYFFDGGADIELKGEERILIPSPKVATYDLKPEMSANEITEALLKELDKDKFDIIVLNFANGDMVGHTGSMDATIKALETLDVCLGKLYSKIEEKGGTMFITADHGNSDTMLDDNENVITSHSLSKVPFIITDKNCNLLDGKLGDIAPTLLSYMNINIPKEMTGNILIK